MENKTPLSNTQVFKLAKAYSTNIKGGLKIIKYIREKYGAVIFHWSKSWYKCWTKEKFDSEINLAIHQSLLEISSLDEKQEINFTSLINKRLSDERYLSYVKPKVIEEREYTYISENSTSDAKNLDLEVERRDLIAKLRKYLLVDVDEVVVDAYLEMLSHGLTFRAAKPKGIPTKAFEEGLNACREKASCVAEVLRKEWE